MAPNNASIQPSQRFSSNGPKPDGIKKVPGLTPRERLSATRGIERGVALKMISEEELDAENSSNAPMPLNSMDLSTHSSDKATLSESECMSENTENGHKESMSPNSMPVNLSTQPSNEVAPPEDYCVSEKLLRPGWLIRGLECKTYRKGNPSEHSDTSEHEVKTSEGLIFVRYRKYVVIEIHDGVAVCLPIFTFRGTSLQNMSDKKNFVAIRNLEEKQEGQSPTSIETETNGVLWARRIAGFLPPSASQWWGMSQETNVSLKHLTSIHPTTEEITIFGSLDEESYQLLRALRLKLVQSLPDCTQGPSDPHQLISDMAQAATRRRLRSRRRNQRLPRSHQARLATTHADVARYRARQVRDQDASRRA